MKNSRNENKILSTVWLAGFIDGRGGFFVHQTTKKYKQFIVKVASNDSYTLNVISASLSIIGVKHLTIKKAVVIYTKEEIKKLLYIILPFIQIKGDEIIKFRKEMDEYELSFMGVKE